MTNNLEYRSIDVESVCVDAEKRTISGRAIVYNSPSVELSTSDGLKFREVLLPGSATDSLKTNDILALRDHDTSLLLGRTSSGTLKLEEREDGIYYVIEVPETTYGNDLLVSAARGDLKGMSFGFKAVKQRMYTRADGMKMRELSAINVKEISVVANPAYLDTTLALRTEDFASSEVKPEAKPEDNKPKSDPVKDKDWSYKLKILSLKNIT